MVILPTGITVEYANSALPSQAGFFVPQRSVGTFGKWLAGGPAHHAGAAVNSFECVLVFLRGIAAGYIWRDYISRVRHERARREEKRLSALASSVDLPAFLSRSPDA
jgi:hypothetical protein